MIPLTEFHCHTTFCDGNNTPAEMARAAFDAGLVKLGFSGHSHTPFDESYCMTVAGTVEYRREIERLKAEYTGRLEIFCGVEQDYYADAAADAYDYAIGSVHYIRLGEEYFPMDEGNENLQRAADRYFGGDLRGVLEAYYDTVADVVNKTDCDIIGHFDLPTKYNEFTPVFDVNADWYRKAWQRAARRLLKTGVPFEINTGAIARGRRRTPYPSEEILAFLADHGGRCVLSGDAHTAGSICYGFCESLALAARVGIPIEYPPKFGI